MNRQQAEERFTKLGLTTRFIADKPGVIYEPHRHEGVYLYTLQGSARLKLEENDWQTILPGQEIRISDNQLHEAVAGAEGWAYVFAASAAEIKRQGL